jgi:hypothetical protein
MKTDKTPTGMTSVTADKADAPARKKGGSKAVSSVAIEKADNGGATVRVSFRGTDRGGPSFFEAEQHAFGSVGDALEMVEGLLGSKEPS